MSEAVGKRALGTPYLRVDALSKTSGRARYTDDLPMRYALRQICPQYHCPRDGNIR